MRQPTCMHAQTRREKERKRIHQDRRTERSGGGKEECVVVRQKKTSLDQIGSEVRFGTSQTQLPSGRLIRELRPWARLGAGDVFWVGFRYS
jgi:hypothetical protein